MLTYSNVNYFLHLFRYAQHSLKMISVFPAVIPLLTTLKKGNYGVLVKYSSQENNFGFLTLVDWLAQPTSEELAHGMAVLG